jgi:hypothetical protein
VHDSPTKLPVKVPPEREEMVAISWVVEEVVDCFEL